MNPLAIVEQFNVLEDLGSGLGTKKGNEKGDANHFLDEVTEIDVCVARCLDEHALLPVK